MLYPKTFAAIAAISAAATCHSQATQTVAPQPAAPKVLQSESGRFVLGQISQARADQFLLDTRTGRVWQVVVRQILDEDGKPTGRETNVLQQVMFVDKATGRDVATPPQ